MRFRSFIIAYALVLAILLFADRRPHPTPQDRYSHVIDLTDAPNGVSRGQQTTIDPQTAAEPQTGVLPASRTRIVAPGVLIPGTWTAGQIPPERLVAPLIVIDLNTAPAASSQITLDDIAAWETAHGAIPQGAVVAIRRTDANHPIAPAALPITAQAAQFLMDARYTTGFVIETPADFSSDRALARQVALHGSYVVESTASLNAVPATGSLIIVAPAKNKSAGRTSVRVLAMVR
jgi:kynurenine formamidase